MAYHRAWYCTALHCTALHDTARRVLRCYAVCCVVLSLPVSISLSALGILYSSGFINPSDGLPAARRLSLTREKTPAAVGLAQEAGDMVAGSPPPPTFPLKSPLLAPAGPRNPRTGPCPAA